MIGKYSDEMTFDYIMNRMLESVPDTVDKREGSIIYDALAPAAAELVKCYMELDVVMDETFVDTASLQYLMLRCKERGVAIQGETAAVIEGVFTPSSVELTAGLRFNCDEVNYTITEKISAGHYKLEAETLGTVGNKYTGLLLPIQTVNGLDTAQIAAVLIPAEDGDTTDTLREKYYASIDGEAFGGNVADYREKVNAITGVGGVKVYPVWNGGGTVKLTIIASDYTAPSSELISKVQTAIDPEGNQGEGLGLAPIGHTVTVAGARCADIAITTNITFATGWAWSSAQSQVESAVKMYFAELAKVWADSATTVVRISQIETHLLALDCVVDVEDTTVNGSVKNIELAADDVRKKLQDYLPPILLKTYEFPLLCETEQPEIDRLHDAADAVLDAQFLSTAGEYAIQRYEKIFGVVPQDTDTLDERRFKVLTRINTQLPFSVRRLRQQLATLCGEDGYKLELDGDRYTLTVKVALTAKRNQQAVEELLADIVPANMICTTSLLYNQHADLTRFTHAQLALLTHFEIREEVLPDGE